ncbi:MAG: maltose acetyltransferase domain-containing protein [Negativicutes bacterium]
MTEKEKMLQGELYDPSVAELLTERQFAKEILFDYNALRPGEIKKKNEIILKKINLSRLIDNETV